LIPMSSFAIEYFIFSLPTPPNLLLEGITYSLIFLLLFSVHFLAHFTISFFPPFPFCFKQFFFPFVLRSFSAPVGTDLSGNYPSLQSFFFILSIFFFSFTELSALLLY
jgi:hypothetical protein